MKVSRLLIILGLLIAMAASCTRTITEQVYQDRYHTDTLKVTQLHRDSIYVHDSIAILQKGDTIFVTKTKNQYRYLNHTDTIYKAKTDTIVKVQTKEIEKPLTKWQETKMKVGGYALTALTLVLFIICVWAIKKLRNKYPL